MEAAPLSTDDLKTLASTTAQEYGLNVSHFMATINCESGWNPSATSTTGDFGLVQINAKAHPEIGISDMLNPNFAITWMAQQWTMGHQTEWTCWKEMYGA